MESQVRVEHHEVDCPSCGKKFEVRYRIDPRGQDTGPDPQAWAAHEARKLRADFAQRLQRHMAMCWPEFRTATPETEGGT